MTSNTKTRIRAAALGLFLQRGYARTSIGAIEKKAGLAPRAGGFYRHYKSKEALLKDLAQSQIVERPEDFSAAGILPLPSTEAELLVIGRAYLAAGRRQRRFAGLIAECRRLKVLPGFEQQANESMQRHLSGWLATKPASQGLKGAALAALAFTVFGGLLFYLQKRSEGIEFPGFDEDAFVGHWARFWAPILDLVPASPRKAAAARE